MNHSKILPLVALMGVLICLTSWASPNKDDEKVNVHTIKMNSLDGNEVDFKEKYAGKVILAVNVASRCGYTRQYAGLQELYEKYKEKGLVVLGFPCNQFGQQEPGNAKEIAEFCDAKFGVTFDMFEKADVNGKDASELFQYLTSTNTDMAEEGKVRWNFEKFVVDGDGNLVARFGSGTEPEDKELIEVIEKQIAALKN